MNFRLFIALSLFIYGAEQFKLIQNRKCQIRKRKMLFFAQLMYVESYFFAILNPIHLLILLCYILLLFQEDPTTMFQIKKKLN